MIKFYVTLHKYYLKVRSDEEDWNIDISYCIE